MHVANIRIDDSPDAANRVRVSADVSCDDRPGRTETLWYDLPTQLKGQLAPSGDPWLAALLPLAARLGEPLHIEAAVDPLLLENSRELLEWWRYWFPAMQVVPVRPVRPERPSAVAVDATARPARTAQFFSGGVDSFFTLLRHADAGDPVQVDDLLVGWGFDIPLADVPAFARVEASLTAAAERLGKRLLPFATNFRETRLGGVPWGTIAHGNAMASVALLLGRSHGRILIPSTDGYRETGPWGSHAMTDHLFSTTATRIVHDGSAFSRFQKVALVATSPAALGALRVCWRSRSDANCGACEKCLRTMVALDLCGVLDRAATFPGHTLDLDQVARIHCPRTGEGSLQLYYLEMLEEAHRRGRADIARALRRALRASTRRDPLLRLTERLRETRIIGPLVAPLDAALRRPLVF